MYHAGKILTQLAMFWFRLLAEKGIANHIVTDKIEEMEEMGIQGIRHLKGRGTIFSFLFSFCFLFVLFFVV